MAIAGAFSRSVFRSSSIRNAAARIASEAKAKPKASSSSSFRQPNQNPLSQRIFRSPVELSSCVETLLPYHSANSSALLISKLGVAPRAYGWLLEASNDDL